MPTSPDVDNYFIGKGIIKFTPEGGAQRDLGNAPEVELTPAIERLDHFSSRSGVRSKDLSVVLEKTLTLRVVLDEITPENLQLALLGSTPVGGSFNIFAQSEIKGQIDFEGTNDVGQQVSMTLPSVSFTPSGSLNLISDEFGQIELTGEVLVQSDSDGDSFGTMTVEESS